MYRNPERVETPAWVMSFGLQKIRIKCKGWNLNQLLKMEISGNSMQISPWGVPGNCFLLLFEYLKLCSSTAVSAAGSGNSTGSHWTCIHAGRFTELTCLSLVQCSTLTQQQSYTQTAEQRLDKLKCFWGAFCINVQSPQTRSHSADNMAKVTATCTTPPMVCEFSLICCLSPWELRSCDCELPVREREQTPVWQIYHLIRAFCLPDEIHSFQLSPDCNSAEIKTSFGVKQSGWSCSAGVFQHCVFRGKDTPKESLCFSGRPPTVFIARKVQLLIYEQQVGVLPSPQWSQEFVSVFYGAFIVFIRSQIPLKRKMRATGCPVQTRICRNSLEYTSPLPLGILPVWVPRSL